MTRRAGTRGPVGASPPPGAAALYRSGGRYSTPTHAPRHLRSRGLCNYSPARSTLTAAWGIPQVQLPALPCIGPAAREPRSTRCTTLSGGSRRSVVIGNHDVVPRCQVRLAGGGRWPRARLQSRAARLRLHLPGRGDSAGGGRDIPDDAAAGAVFRRTGGTRAGRDGCAISGCRDRLVPRSFMAAGSVRLGRDSAEAHLLTGLVPATVSDGATAAPLASRARHRPPVTGSAGDSRTSHGLSRRDPGFCVRREPRCGSAACSTRPVCSSTVSASAANLPPVGCLACP